MNLDFDPEWIERAKDRITAVYEGRIPDRVPGYTVEDYPMPAPARMCFDPELNLDYQIAKLHMMEEDGFDVVAGVYPFLNTTFFPSLFGAEIDVPPNDLAARKPYYQRTGDWPRVRVHPLKDIRDARHWDVPDVRKCGQGPMLIRMLEYFIRETRGRINVGVFHCDGPLFLAHGLMGEQLFVEFYDHPDDVKALLELCARTIIEVTRVQKGIVGEPRTACRFTQDDVTIPEGHGGIFMALTQAEMISPEIYREFVRPFDIQVLDAFGGGGIHTCGNHAHLFGEFSTLPISMIRFYAGSYEPHLVKETVGKDKVILGVKAAARGGAVPTEGDLISTIEQCKAGGRFILGPNGYRGAMRGALEKAGRYAAA
jgi:uroporphyrinogen-III decarboxylase